MTVPITGALILALGVGLFLFSPRLLYAALIISIPFSATAVVNLGSGDEGKGIAAWLFLGSLWVLREMVSGRPPWHTRGWFASRRFRFGLLAFLGAVIVSLAVPLILNGTSWVPSPDPTVNATVPLQFSFYNVTQTAYLAFGVVLGILIAAENCHPAKLLYTLKLYVGSCVFAAGWGLFQLWCNLTGRMYPSYLFNTSQTASALGYKETLSLAMGSVTRVSSVALEPSVFAEEILLALVVLLVSMTLNRPVFSKKWDRAAVVLIVAALVASTSTTAYVGMFFALIAAGVALRRARKPTKRYFVLAGTAAGVGVLVAVLAPLMGQLARTVILYKLQSGSGMARLQSVTLAAQDFLRYPIFGAGWHSVDCWDLVFLIMANTGIVGLLAFAYFLVPVFKGLWVSAGKGKGTAVVLLATVGLAVILAEAAGLTYSAGYDWLVFGLGAAAVVAVQSGRTLKATGPGTGLDQTRGGMRAETSTT